MKTRKLNKLKIAEKDSGTFVVYEPCDDYDAYVTCFDTRKEAQEYVDYHNEYIAKQNEKLG